MTKNGRVTNKDLYNEITRLKEYFENHYVSKQEFWPVRTIVYGMVGSALLAIVGAIIAQVVTAN